jgi:HAMP domain-containing protein
MKEFWFWVLIVTLLLAILAFSLVAMFHVDKQLRETKAILQRVEQLDKEKKNDRRKKDPDEE